MERLVDLKQPLEVKKLLILSKAVFKSDESINFMILFMSMFIFMFILMFMSIFMPMSTFSYI